MFGAVNILLLGAVALALCGHGILALGSIPYAVALLYLAMWLMISGIASLVLMTVWLSLKAMTGCRRGAATGSQEFTVVSAVHHHEGSLDRWRCSPRWSGECHLPRLSRVHAPQAVDQQNGSLAHVGAEPPLGR